MTFKAITVFFIAFTISLALLVGLLSFWFPELFITYCWISLTFFATLSFLLSTLSFFGIKSSNNTVFLGTFYSTFLLKLFLSAGFVVLMATWANVDILPFIISFALFYFAYTFFETVMLVQLNKKVQQAKKLENGKTD